MHVRRSNAYREGLPSLFWREAVLKLEPRERRWLGRSLLHELLHNQRTVFIGVLGGALMLLGIMLLAGDERRIPVPMEVSFVALVIGTVLLTMTLRHATRLVRSEFVQLLLRLDRCGCCAQRRAAGIGTASHEPHSPSPHGWTCSECGSTWWAGRADRSGKVYRDAA